MRPTQSNTSSPVNMLAKLTQGALQAGQTQQAVTLARQLISQAPKSVDAHALLCRALRLNGDGQQAIEHGLSALNWATDKVLLLTEIAMAQRALGLLTEAENSYRQALAQTPNSPILQHNLANLLQRRQAWDEAESRYRAAIALAPTMAEAHTELGSLLQAVNREEEARLCFAEALAVRPNFSPAWQRLNASLNAGDPVDAIHKLQTGTHSNRSTPRVLITMAEAALSLDPENVLGHYTKGLALRLQGRLEEALTPLEKALSLQPNHPIALQCLYLHTVCLMDKGNVYQAMPGAQQLLARSQSASEQSKAFQLLAGLHFEAAEIQTALSTYERAVELGNGALPPRISYCAAHLYAPDKDGMSQMLIAKSLIGAIERGLTPEPHTNVKDGERRLKVGYLSGDFRLHSCAYFLAPLLTHHDRDQIELFAYSTERFEDEVTARFKQLVPNWRQVADLSPTELAQQIRADGIDILVDLAGLTDGSRLPTLSEKPAPIQISWLGYLGSIGLKAMDYRLTDEWVDPPGSEGMCIETPMRLHRPYICYEPPEDAPDVSAPPMLTNGYPTFGSFNALTKLSEPCLAMWCQVLNAIPNARLLIKTRALTDATVRAKLMDKLTAHGIHPDRVTLQGWTPNTSSHLDIYNEVDVALDSSPFNGVTTTCEASWMGVPVVSLVGQTFASRQGLTLLQALGTPDQATYNVDAFVQRCMALVQNPDQLVLNRAALRSKMAASPLMDGVGFAQSVESAFRQAWLHWCN